MIHAAQLAVVFEGIIYEPEYIFVIIVSLVTLAVLIYVAYRILRSPFRYPYYTRTSDVSRKRNVDIADCIDGFLCNRAN